MDPSVIDSRVHLVPISHGEGRIIINPRLAKELFEKCFPDYPFKAFHCRTWLLAPQLRSILKPESNILSFQNRFIRVPYRSNGTECISFLYSTLADIPEDWNDLPENTSLQRAVKAIYLDGGCIHEGEGIFF